MPTGSLGIRSQHLDVGVRDSGIIVACPYTWTGNLAFSILIAWSKGLSLDVWLHLPPEAQLKETELGCGSISFMKWA